LDLEVIGIDMVSFNNSVESITKEMTSDPKEKRESETKELKPYKMTHVLISFPPEKIVMIQSELEKIMNHDFVEYDQISN